MSAARPSSEPTRASGRGARSQAMRPPRDLSQLRARRSDALRRRRLLRVDLALGLLGAGALLIATPGLAIVAVVALVLLALCGLSLLLERRRSLRR